MAFDNRSRGVDQTWSTPPPRACQRRDKALGLYLPGFPEAKLGEADWNKIKEKYAEGMRSGGFDEASAATACPPQPQNLTRVAWESLKHNYTDEQVTTVESLGRTHPECVERC